MSTYRKFLRSWLTVSSLLGFLLGWVLVSHTAEPEATITTSEGQTLTVEMPPIPSVENLAATSVGTNGIQTFTFNQSQSSLTPRMRTGGS